MRRPLPRRSRDPDARLPAPPAEVLCRPAARATHGQARGHYVLLLEEHETKNGRSFEQPLPPTLTPPIERYLEEYRSMLLGGTQGKEGITSMDHLWVSWRGEPLAETGVYDSVTCRTCAAFVVAIPPHRFRDSAVTSLGGLDPKLVWLAPALLHHTDRPIARRHFDQARGSRAVGLWQERVRAERREVLNKTRLSRARTG